jgi:hypothetical protein
MAATITSQWKNREEHRDESEQVGMERCGREEAGEEKMISLTD